MRGRKLWIGFILALAMWAAPAKAQTSTVVSITFDGGNGTLNTCANILTEDGSPVGGEMCLTSSYYCGPGFGIVLENVNGPVLPNNGFMCGFYNMLTYGQKEWGTRTDGSTMNGAEAGDYFIQLASTMIPVENNDSSYWGQVPYVATYVNLNLTMTYKPVQVCRRGSGCHMTLQPHFTGGNGTLQFGR